MRTTSSLSVQVTKSIRPSTKPIALKRNSPAASGSSNSITYGSKNTFAAVRKSTPCFFRLASSLARSHSKSIANPDFEYTDIQYLVDRFHETNRFKFPGPHPEETGCAQRRWSSRRMAACTAVIRGHPSRRPASLRSAGLLRMRSGEDAAAPVETPPHPAASGRCFASPSARRPLPASGARSGHPLINRNRYTHMATFMETIV
jgi:hypothetical protein